MHIKMKNKFPYIFLWRMLPFILLTAALLLVSACSKSAGTTAVQAIPADGPPLGYSIAVRTASKVLAYVTLDQLNKLEKIAVRAADRNNEGPTLSSVLSLAGVNEYKSVKVVGMVRGRMADADLTLEKQQVTDKTILDITNRGTCKFVSPDVVYENWIYDVAALEIEE
jgi:hypothetical protein